MTGPFVSRITPRWYELDPYGHVNHSVYVQYFEVARVELLEHVGFGIDRMADEGMSIVVTEIRTRFHSPAVLGDELVVETAMAALRRVSTVWHQRITRDADDVATQEVTAALLGPDGRPQRLSPEFAAAMEPFAVPATRPGQAASPRTPTAPRPRSGR